ncbi:hypothetical protein BG004_001192 [Podila humilis]|nr:hypothetical protein BG004_001192 [Podila humilis]
MLVFGLMHFITLYLLRMTPKDLHFKHGAIVAILSSVADGLSLEQTRGLYMKARAENASEETKWAVAVKGPGWKGFWVPFHHQGSETKAATQVLDSDIGKNCDIVLFYTHGGGFVFGHPLQNLSFIREMMQYAYVTKGLSPETPFHGAINEYVAAYTSLIKEYAIDPQKIITYGDSAGGNLAHVLPLKIRDEFPELGLPAGTITSSPYFFPTEPMKSLYDYLSPLMCHRFIAAYSHHEPATLASPYYSPFNASSLSGLPPMLVFFGGLELFRPSIERFVDKSRADNCSIKAVLVEARAHCWFLSPPISTPQDRLDVIEACVHFLAKIAKNE